MNVWASLPEDQGPRWDLRAQVVGLNSRKQLLPPASTRGAGVLEASEVHSSNALLQLI